MNQDRSQDSGYNYGSKMRSSRIEDSGGDMYSKQF